MAGVRCFLIVACGALLVGCASDSAPGGQSDTLGDAGLSDEGGEDPGPSPEVGPETTPDVPEPDPEPFWPRPSLSDFCAVDSATVEARIDTLLAELSTEDKLPMMHGANFLPVDGVWLVEGHAPSGIPGLHMLDGPRGLSRFSGLEGTAFPVGMARGATWDVELEERVGAAMAREIRAAGADVLLAPTINILRHPRWGRAQETYGEDVHHMGEMGVAFVRGVQSEKVIASPKHLAANSIEDTRWEVDVKVDERSLREIYLPHFRRVVQEAHAGSVMSAYNQVNGSWCGEHMFLIRQVLKDEWGFHGFVESDWIEGVKSTVPAALAGLDIEMPVAQFFGEPLTEAVAAGDVPMEVVDEAVRRIVRTQLCFELDTDPPVKDVTKLVAAENVDVAVEVAQKSIVLLKNEGDLLPLDLAAAPSIVLTGDLRDAENIGDGGSSSVISPEITSALEGLSARTAVEAVDATLPLSPEAEASLSGADVVVLVTGLTKKDEGEGQIAAGDRETMALSDAQIAEIEAVAALNPNVVVVLQGGSAITMSWLDKVPALLMSWYPGLAGGTALADVLFGDVNPSGRLPISFPVAEADLPEFDNRSLEVTYGFLHGYRWLESKGTAPLFPFGYGLSYARFSYDDLTLGSDTLAADGALSFDVTVTNTGDVAGTDVVQAYVATEGSRVERAPQDLRAFARVELAPGESKTVTMTIKAKDLAFYDVDAGAWEVEALTYTLRVGPHSQELPLSGTFTLQ